MEVKGQLHGVVALCLAKVIPYPLKGGLLGPRAGLDTLEKRKISYP
jgi:hypothetical protein